MNEWENISTESKLKFDRTTSSVVTSAAIDPLKIHKFQPWHARNQINTIYDN